MARRSGVIAQIQREHTRQRRAASQAQAAYYRHQQAMRREAERAAKAAQRAAVADDRERKRLYLEARTAEVAANNADVQARLAELDSLLASTLAVDDFIDFRQLRKQPQHPPFDPGRIGSACPSTRLGPVSTAPPASRRSSVRTSTNSNSPPPNTPSARHKRTTPRSKPSANVGSLLLRQPTDSNASGGRPRRPPTTQ